MMIRNLSTPTTEHRLMDHGLLSLFGKYHWSGNICNQWRDDEIISIPSLRHDATFLILINSTEVSPSNLLGFETELNYGANDTYEIIVRASDNGTNPGCDEQNITVTITDDGTPSFDSNTSTTYQIEEDTIIRVRKPPTDDAGNPTFGLPTSPYSISVNPCWKCRKAPNSFSYKPDPHFWTEHLQLKSKIYHQWNRAGITMDVHLLISFLSSGSIIDVSESQRILDNYLPLMIQGSLTWVGWSILLRFCLWTVLLRIKV